MILSATNKRILEKTSLKKGWNAFKIHLSFWVSKLLQRNIIWGLPYAFSLEPTTSCNLRCPECPSGLRSFTRNTGSIALDNFKTIIDQYKATALHLNLYFQGEPYLNKSFLDLVKYASEQKIFTSTSTNAHYLTPENAEKTVLSGLDKLIISIDGTTQETYQNYRVGGTLEKVISGTKNILAAKQKLNSKYPLVYFQFLVVKPNEHQIDEILNLGKELGVDEVTLKSAQIYDYKNGNELIPTKEKYSRYIKQQNGEYKLKYELKNECWKMWHSNVVTWDGDVVPCCFDKDATYKMGNLATNSLNEIWKSNKYQQFRKQLWKDRESIDICQNCTEGAKIFNEV